MYKSHKLNNPLYYELLQLILSNSFNFELKNDFLNIFQKNKNPEDIDLIEVNPMPLPNLLKHIGFVSSTSEARRLITQKALKINDNNKITTIRLAVDIFIILKWVLIISLWFFNVKNEFINNMYKEEF